MDLNELRDKAYQCACEHGFHDNEYPDEHWLMLTIGEVAEMVEADRKGLYPDTDAFKKCDLVNDEEFKKSFERFIKNTVYDEMADIVIRLLDFAGLKKYDMTIVETARELIYTMADSKFDGEKQNHDTKTLIQLGYKMCHGISDQREKSEIKAMGTIIAMLTYCYAANIDIDWYIQQKMRYNSLRPYKNGKKY